MMYYILTSFVFAIFSFSFTEENTSNYKEEIESVKIGNQVWMKKNLNVDHYRNGDIIPQVTTSSDWIFLHTGAWCYFNNDTTLGKTYGKLYNWYAVNDPRGLAPEGWHVPSVADWTELESSLGGSDIAGGKLKSKGTIQGKDGLWFRENQGATDEFGFAGLPCGYRISDGKYSDFGIKGVWWTSTEDSNFSAWYRSLHREFIIIKKDIMDKCYGFYVRCVKD